MKRLRISKIIQISPGHIAIMQNSWGSKRNLSGGVEVVRNKHPHKLPMLHEEYSLYREHIGSYRILTAQAFDPPTLLPEVPPTDKPAHV